MIFPVMYAVWNVPPDIIVCDSAAVRETDLNFATSWWKARGYSFGEVVFDFKCPKSSQDFFLPDTIIIYDDNYFLNNNNDFGYQRRALTVANHNGGKLRSAIIEIENPSKFILVHEMGHALGWKDFPVSGHIMNGLIRDQGWDDFGLTVVKPE